MGEIIQIKDEEIMSKDEEIRRLTQLLAQQTTNPASNSASKRSEYYGSGTGCFKDL